MGPIWVMVIHQEIIIQKGQTISGCEEGGQVIIWTTNSQDMKKPSPSYQWVVIEVICQTRFWPTARTVQYKLETYGGLRMAARGWKNTRLPMEREPVTISY